VSCPALIANYFKYSNCVYLYNQARPFDLCLENNWVTHSGYFKLYTTILGMIVTDAWKIYKMLADHPFTIFQCSDMLAGDMMNCAVELEEGVVELSQAVSMYLET